MIGNYKNNEEYKEGYTAGVVEGEKDANMLVTPYPFSTDGKEYFQIGYTNGYLMQYIHSLSALYKQTKNPSEAVYELIVTRLEEISASIKNEHEKTSTK